MSEDAGAYLIAYDISHPVRLNRIHRYLGGCALWVQYSVFVARLRPAALAAAAAELRSRMDPRTDDIRIYHLPAFARPVLIGDTLWPEDVLFAGLGPVPLGVFTLPPMAQKTAVASPPPSPPTVPASTASPPPPSKTTP